MSRNRSPIPPSHRICRRRSGAVTPRAARTTTGRPTYSEWNLSWFEPQYVSHDRPTKFLEELRDMVPRDGERGRPFESVVALRPGRKRDVLEEWHDLNRRDAEAD